jgi:alkyl hydroperoxide reductase subunit F
LFFKKLFCKCSANQWAALGAAPATEFAKGIVALDKIGQVVINPRNQRTSADGIWAAGDCTDGLYHQNNIAVGDAVKALEDIYMWLQKTG